MLILLQGLEKESWVKQFLTNYHKQMILKLICVKSRGFVCRIKKMIVLLLQVLIIFIKIEETCTFSKKSIAIFSVKCDNLFPSPLICMVRQFRALAGMRKEILHFKSPNILTLRHSQSVCILACNPFHENGTSSSIYLLHKLIKVANFVQGYGLETSSLQDGELGPTLSCSLVQRLLKGIHSLNNLALRLRTRQLELQISSCYWVIYCIFKENQTFIKYMLNFIAYLNNNNNNYCYILFNRNQ